MKTRSFLLFVIAAILLQSCIVKSLQPFFKEGDVIFNSTLLDTWIDQNGNKWEIDTIDVKNFPNTYFMRASIADTNKILMVHMFKLNGKAYLDFVPLPQDIDTDHLFEKIYNYHFMPTHSIARIDKQSNNEIVLVWFNEKWLKSLFDQKRIKISHEVAGDSDYILTASTEELQKFIIKYDDDFTAFGRGDSEVVLALRRGL